MFFLAKQEHLEHLLKERIIYILVQVGMGRDRMALVAAEVILIYKKMAVITMNILMV